MGRLARLQCRMSELVSVHDVAAKLGEPCRDRAFARRNVAGETDAENSS